jgi:adenosylmethionine-8-amino-7-oxononanoate aminotransferase
MSLAGCSTLNHRNKALAYMGGAFVGGAVAGSVQTNERQNSELHGLMWGSAAAAAVGATMLYMYDESNEVKERDYKIRELEAKLSDFKKHVTTVEEKGTSDFMESDLPKDYRHLVEPGRWKLYEIDEWKKSGDGEFVHQDKLLEISPAKMKIEN